MPSPALRNCILVAICAAAVVFAWMFFVVHYAHSGNWTSLFCIGDHTPQPPQLEASERLYRWPHSQGYDGAAYHALAHDPWLARGFQNWTDNPRMRSRRLLVPALAWTLALGSDRRVHAGYVATILVFVAAGAFWVAEYAVTLGRTAVWGLCYILLPSSVISVDRMLTDLPMVTLLAGFLYYMRRENLSILWALAALACLARETGVCVVIGYAAWLAWRRLYSKAAVMLSAAVPLMLWIAYVDFYTSPGASFWTSYVGPARDLIAAFVRVRDYPVSALIQAIIRILDIIALLGFLLGFGRGVLLARRGGRLAFIIVPFLAVAALLTSMNDQFTDVYGYGRLFSPVLLVLLWDALASKRWLDIAPAAMILSRTVAIPVHETLTALSRVRL